MNRGNSSPKGNGEINHSKSANNNSNNNNNTATSSKRNSGLFSFLRWFNKSSVSRESVVCVQNATTTSATTSPKNGTTNSGSNESLTSVHSAGTVASFSYVPPDEYEPIVAATNASGPRTIDQGPETDTYKARLRQRDKRRETDKDTTLRKKYNLFFNRDTLLKQLKETAATGTGTACGDCKSLPLMMTRTTSNETNNCGTPSDGDDRERRHACHRRTASESSKVKRAGAYCHVKGKRKAPAPPPNQHYDVVAINQGGGTNSTRRKKRLAPRPPSQAYAFTHENLLNAIEYADADDFALHLSARNEKVKDVTVEVEEVKEVKNNDEVIFNDCLKLECGILKPAKEDDGTATAKEATDKIINITTSTTSAPVLSGSSSSGSNNNDAVIGGGIICHSETPVSPRPWYKRNANVSANKEKKLDGGNKLPDVPFVRNSTIDLSSQDVDNNKEINGKRKSSALTFLTNISELDREASRIVKEQQQQKKDENVPLFMRPKDDQTNTNNNNNINKNMDTLQQPNKRRSARDLIAKFNAITNVTKVTVNSAFFGGKESQQLQQQQPGKKDYFGRQTSANAKLEDAGGKKETDRHQQPSNGDKNFNPLMKSESANVTPLRADRKNWNCPRCNGENEYWRIICHVCSTIKPYFDDLSTVGSGKEKENDAKTPFAHQQQQLKKKNNEMPEVVNPTDRQFERSKTQIGFSILTNNKHKEPSRVQAADEKRPVDETNKKEEREKLKRMLIEMKNSLPKKKHVQKQIQRKSIIEEKPEQTVAIKHTPERSAFVLVPPKKDNNNDERMTNCKNDTNNNKGDSRSAGSAQQSNAERTKNEDVDDDDDDVNNRNGARQKKDERSYGKISNATSSFLASSSSSSSSNGPISHVEPERIARVVIATTETVYENIKMKKPDVDHNKPLKVSSSVQTTGVIKKAPPLNDTESNEENVAKNADGEKAKKANFELLRPKDFADIYVDKKVAKQIDNSNVNNSNNNSRIYANLAENDDLSLFFNMPQKLTDIKVTGTTTAYNTDTIEINRLLRRLETAIAKGEMSDAAVYARDLAQLKVNCSVVRQRTAEKDAQQSAKSNHGNDGFTVDMYVEDKISHRGPFPIKVRPHQTVAELKVQIEREYEIPRNVQRWILGKELAVDDESTLKDHHVTIGGCPIFLYLVAPTTTMTPNTNVGQEEKQLREPENTIAVIGSVTAEEDEAKKEEPKVVSAIYKATVIKCAEMPSTSKEASAPPLDEPSTSGGQPVAKYPDEDDDDVEDTYDTNTLKATAKNEWQCSICTFLNPNGGGPSACEMCLTPKPIDDLPTATASPSSARSPKTAKRLKRRAPVKPRSVNDQQQQQHYMQLVDLDNKDLVENRDPFDCPVCFVRIEPGDGVTLRECIHQFCKECLAHTIAYSDEAEIKCPYRDERYSCEIALQDREIKALVTRDVYEQHLAKSVAQAENMIDKSFHCKTPDCRGWCIFEDNVNEFKCPVCKCINCLTCQAIHTGQNCKQYQESMNRNAETDEDAKRTREMLDEMVAKGEALVCPACKVVLMKKWGCDWVRCSMCKTEICWVTRGPRWGPAGKGDTSGGCKCGVNGVKCHPQCNYCH